MKKRESSVDVVTTVSSRPRAQAPSSGAYENRDASSAFRSGFEANNNNNNNNNNNLRPAPRVKSLAEVID